MRHELKFLVSYDEADRVRDVVRRYCDVDKYAQGREGDRYTVRSVYFDSPQGAIYEHKVEGLRTRVKVRVRGYNDVEPSSTVGLELKRKRAELSWKTRARCTLDKTALWLSRPSSYTDNDQIFKPEHLDAANQFHYVVTRYTLRPVNVVIYEREPYVGRHDPTLRVTFDLNLRGKLVSSLMELGDEATCRVFDRHLILEVKFDYHYPLWIKPVLAELGLKRRALSKYVMVLDEAARRERRPPEHVFTRLRSAGLGRAAMTLPPVI